MSSRGSVAGASAITWTGTCWPLQVLARPGRSLLTSSSCAWIVTGCPFWVWTWLKESEMTAIVSPAPYSKVVQESYHEGWRSQA